MRLAQRMHDIRVNHDPRFASECGVERIVFRLPRHHEPIAQEVSSRRTGLKLFDLHGQVVLYGWDEA